MASNSFGVTRNHLPTASWFSTVHTSVIVQLGRSDPAVLNMQERPRPHAHDQQLTVAVRRAQKEPKRFIFVILSVGSQA